ncbi:MAG TPA: ferritin-like domain-containing protein [Candidatus Limnocylindrales bacterium]|nr:ferritin-like domain-containing protein [Candidatus Limnocylindrales bacterium]
MQNNKLSANLPNGDDLGSKWRKVTRRRSFLQGMGVAGSIMSAGKLLAADRTLHKGDVAILRFLAAAELVESDFWQQYNELGGVNGGNPAYKAALENLDGDMPQYVADNTDDEMSHAAFLNAYLVAKGEQPVNLDAFRTLPSSKATGANQSIKRLTNLSKLTVDTSWYTRYRGTGNPDFGATFPQAVNIVGEPTIPQSDSDTPPNQMQPVPPVGSQETRMQAIANSAAFHFATFDAAGSSVYTNLSLKVRDPEVLRIVVSILGVEVNHFAVWHDKAGNAVSQPLAGVKDPETGVTFQDLNSAPFGGEAFQTNLIFPEPCQFIAQNLPACAVIRPSLTQNAGAVATATAIAASHIFDGQPQAFFNAVLGLAMAADAAQRDD